MRVVRVNGDVSTWSLPTRCASALSLFPMARLHGQRFPWAPEALGQDHLRKKTLDFEG
jgi:hypothetical protein